MAKSTTKYYKWRGKCAWAKIYPDNYDEYKGDKKWKICFYPDEATIDKIKAAGLQNKWKDDDGEKSGVTGKFISLIRPFEKEFKSGMTYFTPPDVLDKNGKKLVFYTKGGGDDYEMHGDKIIIGNGSEVELNVEVYDTNRFGKGSKLMSVKIIDLIEYVPPEDMSENEVDELEESGEFEIEELPAKEKPKKVAW